MEGQRYRVETVGLGPRSRNLALESMGLVNDGTPPACLEDNNLVIVFAVGALNLGTSDSKPTGVRNVMLMTDKPQPAIG